MTLFRTFTISCLRFAVFAPLFLGFSAAGAAEGPRPGTRDLLAMWLKTIKPNSPEWKTMMGDGASRSEFCVRCHGRDGVSIMPLVPNLAGQNPFYLLSQIEQFADDRRRDFIMSPLAKQFTDEDKVLVAFFFSSMQPVKIASDPALGKAGEKLFQQRCVGCHGQDAHGGDKFARLAGQKPVYIKHRLMSFKVAGSNSPMAGLANGLTGQDIDAVASYLSSLP